LLGGKHHLSPFSSDSRATLLPAAVSVPLALLFGLVLPVVIRGFQVDIGAFVIGIIGLGVLTSLDLRRGFKSLFAGFGVCLLVAFYFIDRSAVGQGLSPLNYGDWSFFIVAIPVSLAVLLSRPALAHVKKYKIVWANILGSTAMATGIGLAGMLTTGTPSSGPISLTLFYYLALCVPANAAQIGLFYLIDKWKGKQFSLRMMPTAFFGFNLLSFLGFVNTLNPAQLYMFFSSLVFLPALALTGMGSGALAAKTPRIPKGAGISGAVPSSKVGPATKHPPSIRLTASSMAVQGREFALKIATEVQGRMKNMARVIGEIRRPSGRRESVRISRVGSGEYKAFYKPPESGSYTMHVSATDQQHQTADQSFSFSVQPPAKQPAPSSTPPVHSRPTPTPAPSPPSRSAATSVFAPPPPLQPMPQKVNLPSLSNWDPKVWVGQEIHGYVVREYIATGLSGYVLRASFEHGGNEMAIKIPILKPGTGTSALEETMSEATRLLELSQQSKYVVQLRGILVDRLNVQEIVKGDTTLYLKSPPAIVMELMKGGAAKALVEDPSYDSLFCSEKWPEIVVLIGQMIATGLETIHNAGFAHLDVKPQNILFNVKPSPTGRDARDQIRSGALIPKLADLGSAVRIGGRVTQFTPEYCPGEQALGDKTTAAMDVYSLGATMYSLLTKTPVNSKKIIGAMNAMTDNPGPGKTNDLRSAWNGFVPDFTQLARHSSLVAVMKKMLAREPLERPNAGSVANSLRSVSDQTP
jgi:hypothetical protein